MVLQRPSACLAVLQRNMQESGAEQRRAHDHSSLLGKQGPRNDSRGYSHVQKNSAYEPNIHFLNDDDDKMLSGDDDDDAMAPF